MYAFLHMACKIICFGDLKEEKEKNQRSCWHTIRFLGEQPETWTYEHFWGDSQYEEDKYLELPCACLGIHAGRCQKKNKKRRRDRFTVIGVVCSLFAVTPMKKVCLVSFWLLQFLSE